MSGPLVSVVMPAYNHEPFVGEAIDSALAQSHRQLEVIVVDDGSTDGTWDVIADRAAADPRVRAITHPGHVNRGVHETTRHGLSLARGRIIAFLASDDRWWPDRLAHHLRPLRFAGATYGRVRLIDSGGTPTGVHWGVAPPRGVPLLHQLLSSNIVPATSVTYRREALRRAGGIISTEFFEDLDIMLRISATSRVRFVDDCQADYRESHTSGLYAAVAAAGNARHAYASAVRHVAGWPGLPGRHRRRVRSAAGAWELLLALTDGAPLPARPAVDELDALRQLCHVRAQEIADHASDAAVAAWLQNLRESAPALAEAALAGLRSARAC